MHMTAEASPAKLDSSEYPIDSPAARAAIPAATGIPTEICKVIVRHGPAAGNGTTACPVGGGGGSSTEASAAGRTQDKR